MLSKLKNVSIENKVLIAKVNQKFSAEIENKNIILLVSVGKENFEEEILKAQILFISTYCMSCTILIADTLQRFNILCRHATDPNFTIDDARKISWEMGSQWIEKYQAFFDKAFFSRGKNYLIMRWDEWLKHKNFADNKKKIIHALANDATYELAMSHTIAEYQARQKDLPTDCAEKLSYYGREYLIEECTIFICLREEGERYILYPGTASAVIKKTFEKMINPYFSSPLEWIPERLQWVDPAQSLIYKRQMEKSNLQFIDGG